MTHSISPKALVQEIYRLYGAGDIEGALALFAPDVVHRACPNTRTQLSGTYQGLEAVRDRIAAIQAFLDIRRYEPERIVAEGDTVAARVIIEGFARGTGEPFATTLGHVVVVAHGRVVEFEEYFDSTYLSRLVGGAIV